MHPGQHPQGGAMIGEMDPETREKYEFVPQAIIQRAPAFFSERGIKFETGLDDLNVYQIAELTMDDLPFALMRYDGTPSDETAIYLPDIIAIEQLPEIINKILTELDLPMAALGWRRERADTPF
jgi:hypothetical protein